jgi:hypothetical protein
MWVFRVKCKEHMSENNPSCNKYHGKIHTRQILVEAEAEITLRDEWVYMLKKIILKFYHNVQENVTYSY